MPEVFSSATSTPTDPVVVEDQPVEPRHHRNVDDYSQVMRDEVECTNPYVAFGPKPVNTSFESQDAQEHIVLFVRKHPIVNVGWSLTTIVLSIAPVFLQFFPFLDFFPERFQLMSVIGWYVFILGFVLEKFLTWFYHVNLLTDERIIDIDFESLLYKRVSAAKIDNIEDVTSSTAGFLGSMLDYGNVHIQTAGQVQEINFETVPQPEKITRLVNELLLEEEREKLEGRIR